MKVTISLFAAAFGIALVFILFSIFDLSFNNTNTTSYTEKEAGFESAPNVPLMEFSVGGGVGYTLSELNNWKPPEGPPRVGVQIGHFENDQVPEELRGLTRNGSGATYGPYTEQETVAKVVELIAEQLTANGIVVDIIPTTVPPGYIADAFISVHADGNNNRAVSGYKIAGPRRDYSGLSSALVDSLYDNYGTATGLGEDAQITRRMTAYYAFNWPRYEHAIHPYTPAAIVETGFLTNTRDRELLIDRPDIVAAGVVDGILEFLANKPDRDPTPQEFYAPELPLSGTINCASIREEERGDSSDDEECIPALFTTDGRSYVVMDPDLATSSFPIAATVAGEYHPVQTLDNYFWFDYEVVGIIREPQLELRTAT